MGECVCVHVCSPTLLATAGHSCRCGFGLLAAESSVWLVGKPHRNVPSSAWGEKGLVGTERDILLRLYLPTPTFKRSQRLCSGIRVA